MWATEFSLCKDMTVEESTRNIDQSNTAQPIKHTQIKWANYTATPWICILTSLVVLLTLSGKVLKDQAQGGGNVQERKECVEKMTYAFLSRYFVYYCAEHRCKIPLCLIRTCFLNLSKVGEGGFLFCAKTKLVFGFFF